MKKLSSFFFICIFSCSSFSQLNIIDASRDKEFKLDLAHLCKATHSKIIFKAFFLNKGGYGNNQIYKSLSNFNSELFDFTLYNTVNNDSVAHDLIRKIQESITKRKPYEEIDKQFYDWDKASGTSSKDLKIIKTGHSDINENKALTQSTVYFCIKNDAVKELLEKNKNNLSIQKLEVNTQESFFYLANINGVNEFFWKLNQLFLFFESNKELLKNQGVNHSEFNIQFQSSGLYGIAPKIKLENSLYSSNHNVQSMIGFDFKIMAFQKILCKNNPPNFDYGFGLGYSRAYLTTTNSIENQSYSTTWTHPQLQGDQIKNVYLNDISERSDLTLNTLNVPLSLRYKCDNKLNFQLNITPSFVLPSNITSRITSGNISYRGQVEGIDDELYNISELGLFDNISLNQSTAQKYSGWGIEFGGNISHVFKTGSVFIGVGYNFQRLKSDFSNERLHLSSDVTDYNSSFSSADGFSLSAIMLNAGISINLNSSEK